MPTLLAIEASPRHEFSTSRKLTAHFIEAWKAAHPGSSVVARDLTKTPRRLSISIGSAAPSRHVSSIRPKTPPPSRSQTTSSPNSRRQITS